MRAVAGLKKHWRLTWLALGCFLVDMGIWLGVGTALKWLSEATSPLTLVELLALILLTVRIGSSVRAAKRAIAA